jgi:putative hemolysin
LYAAFRTEIKIYVRPKYLGLSADLVVKQGDVAEITPIVTAFQKELDEACDGCYEPSFRPAVQNKSG